ncbi:hypothetical protein [Chryseobacterium sp. R2ACT005]|uniref:hypothetical protein n=1 Tax=Chryseobacterium sp. R2ACT005 TaxID=3416668 RepID=UPI003CE9F734
MPVPSESTATMNFPTVKILGESSIARDITTLAVLPLEDVDWSKVPAFHTGHSCKLNKKNSSDCTSV